MTDEANIDILSPEKDDAKDPIIEDKPRKRFGLPVLLSAMFLSSAFGAGAIGLISYFNQAEVPDISPLEAKVEAISTDAQSLIIENKTLKTQIARLQHETKKKSAPASIDLRPLEKRLRNLEQAEPVDINPELLARLEALQDEGSEALDLSDILKRLEALENRPDPAAVMIAPMDKVDLESAMSFPSEAILKSLEKPEGWLKKSLKKHISVQSDENPRYLVELIETSIEAGNIEAAMSAFEKLPPDAQVAGQAWRESLNP